MLQLVPMRDLLVGVSTACAALNAACIVHHLLYPWKERQAWTSVPFCLLYLYVIALVVLSVLSLLWHRSPYIPLVLQEISWLAGLGGQVRTFSR
jgi:hypothetical protein